MTYDHAKAAATLSQYLGKAPAPRIAYASQPTTHTIAEFQRRPRNGEVIIPGALDIVGAA